VVVGAGVDRQAALTDEARREAGVEQRRFAGAAPGVKNRKAIVQHPCVQRFGGGITAEEDGRVLEFVGVQELVGMAGWGLAQECLN